MRNMKNRCLSAFLSLVMILSMIPTAAFAASTVGVTAGFDSDLTVSDADKTATMSVNLSGITLLEAYGMIVDWAELDPYVETVWSDVEYADVDAIEVSANANIAGSGFMDVKTGSLYSYNGIQMTDTQTRVAYATNTTGGRNMNGVATFEFTLDSSIPAGTYDVSVLLYECTGDSNSKYIQPSNQSTWQRATATLTVKDASGNVPQPPVNNKFAISSTVTSGATTGSVTIASEGEAGTLISFSVSPVTGYEIESVTATDTTNSKTLTLTNTSPAGTEADAVNYYSFSMPSGNVQVEVKFKASTPDNIQDTAYDISVNAGTNGSIHSNGVTQANAGDTVTLYVTPNSGYEIQSVSVTAETGAAVTVSGGSTQSGSAYLYTFTMPESDVTASATFKAVEQQQPGGGVDVSAGYIKVTGTVVTGNSNPLPGATVKLVYTTGAYQGMVAATTTSAADGTFELDEVSASYEYTIQAEYDTGIEKGVNKDPGFMVYSKVFAISASSNNTTGQGEHVTQSLTVNLYYEWDVDGDNTVEKIFAGDDDTFLTADDFYQATVAGQTVNVYAGGAGEKNIQSVTAYYNWEIDDDGVKNQVFVGGGYKPGTENDYYLYDVDHDPSTDDVMVYIAADCEPGTSDDYYDSVDVNNDGTKDVVYAGADGQIATEDDWYKVGNTTIYAGEDKVAGTADDWYMEDTDGATDNDGDEKVFIGKDRLPHTADDFYLEDVNSDGQNETIYAGVDADFNTADDYYPDKVGGKDVKVYPGSTGNNADPYEFGLRDDHYDWSVDNTAIVVRVGDDTQAGTADDEFDWTIQDDDNGATVVVVIAGPDGIPGTDDDYYMYDADNDGEDEKVIVGEDGIAGTADDYYDEDVNGDGEDERVYAGADEKFDTSDDHYFDEVADKTVDVIAGEDGHIGTPDDYFAWEVAGEDVVVYVGNDEQAGTSDDWFNWNIQDDDDGEVTVQVIVGEDGVAGTDDDYYMYDADNDGSDEQVFVGEDCEPGTADDYYDEDVNGDGADERVYAGADEKFDTSDDYYFDEVDGEVVDVIAGEDGHIGTPDDYFDWTVGGQDVIVYVGNDEQAGTSDDHYDWTIQDDDNGATIVDVIVGEDGIAGTDDDYYAYDVDNDGEDEIVNIGEDAIPGTADDNYDEDVNGDGVDETVYAGDDNMFDTSDDHYFDEVDGETVDVIAGEDGHIGTPDDYYDWTFDFDGEERPVYVGEDEQAGTPDDWYEYDANEDGTPEQIEAGEGGIPGTPDDHYAFNADEDADLEDVFVGADSQPGTSDDYYDEDVNGDSKDERVYAGDDEEFKTPDDWYNALVKDPADPEKTVVVKVYAGEDTIFSDPDNDDSDDYYLYDVDGDGDDEQIFIDGDSFAGTDDDFYFDNADNDPEDEKIFVGEDEIPMTEDDYYFEDVNGDGEDEKVYAGEDSEFATEDDFYNEDIDGDGEDEKIVAGDDKDIGSKDDNYGFDVDGDGDDEKVFVGDDRDPGTSDDYYLTDADKDGEDDEIYADGDGIPGTDDDFYKADPDKDGEDEDIYVGPDATPGTEDDWYNGDPDGDGDDDVIHVGPDTKPGTEDDYYEVDINGDGEPEQVRPGEDEIYGTPDDEYDMDIDEDGEDETIYVGEDTKPGTEDDWYYPIITFNAGNGKVNGLAVWSVISSDIEALPTASRSGYTFKGWTLENSSAVLTLEQVLALRADTTVYASYRSNYSGGGGGGVSYYTVKFDSNGGSTVPSQSIVSGGKVTEPTNPTRSGYTFTGWYTDDDCTDEFDFDTKVRKSMTLYAGWEKKQDDTVSEKVFRYLTSEHIAYIYGFDDGLVHGDYNMTRAQAAAVFYRLLNDETRAAYKTSYNKFPDVSADAWYNDAVSTLANLGIIAGYSNGNFGPNDPITRAQFATICARIGELKGDGNMSFTDVPSNYWAATYIDGAADQGWVVGYGNGKFGPEDYITRSQVVCMLNRVLERDSITENSFVDFADDAGFRNWADNQDSSAWDYLYLIEAGNGHTYTRDANGVETWTALVD